MTKQKGDTVSSHPARFRQIYYIPFGNCEWIRTLLGGPNPHEYSESLATPNKVSQPDCGVKGCADGESAAFPPSESLLSHPVVREDEIVAALKNNPIVSQGTEGNKSGTLYLITDKKSGRFRPSLSNRKDTM